MIPQNMSHLTIILSFGSFSITIFSSNHQLYLVAFLWDPRCLSHTVPQPQSFLYLTQHTPIFFSLSPCHLHILRPHYVCNMCGMKCQLDWFLWKMYIKIYIGKSYSFPENVLKDFRLIIWFFKMDPSWLYHGQR